MLNKRYTHIRNLSPGGFGQIQLLKDTFLDREVILKSMQNPTDNDQLLREIAGLSKARSRHIVEIYDIFYDSNANITGIVIENLTGKDYKDFHKNHAGDIYELLKTLYQLSSALDELHSAGITHRDLKLENMKDSAAGILKLFDFGLSSNDPTYQTKQNRGTLVYAAPELYHQDATITPEMDIYAFGVCAWALITQNFPSALLERPPQTTEKAPTIDSVIPGKIPKKLVTTIDNCLDTNPLNRPKASEIVDTLKEHLLCWRHKGIFIENANKIFELSKESPYVKISVREKGVIGVRYDGFRFIIEEIEGHLSVNNIPINPGMILHDACVLTFGHSSLKSKRTWVTFYASHPEVTL